MVRASIPERCSGLVCGAPLGRRDGLTHEKDSQQSDLAASAKMIATRSGAHFKNLIKEETAIKFRFALKEEWRGPKAHDCILSCLLAG